MKIFFVIIPAVMCVLSALALIYNKAVAQEVVRKNKSTWEIKLDPVGTRGGVILVLCMWAALSLALTIDNYNEYYPFNLMKYPKPLVVDP